MSPSGASLPLVETVADEIPENFDSREKWSKCESIKEVRDQANCGSCCKNNNNKNLYIKKHKNFLMNSLQN